MISLHKHFVFSHCPKDCSRNGPSLISSGDLTLEDLGKFGTITPPKTEVLHQDGLLILYLHCLLPCWLSPVRLVSLQQGK